MALTRKDAAATLLTALVVLAFLATHQGWDVALIGDSHRWAAGAILLLGALTCGLGNPAQSGPGTKTLTIIGATAGVMGVVALVSGSLTALSLLVAAIVLLWAGATLRHALQHGPRRPLAV